MVKRLLFALLLVSLVGCSETEPPPAPSSLASPMDDAEKIAASAQAVEVPPGVAYKPASAQVNEAALRHIEKWFAEKDASKISAFTGEKLFCGPVLWHSVKSELGLDAGQDYNKATMLDGNDTSRGHEAAFLRHPAAIEKLWRLLQSRGHTGAVTVRKLRPDELRHYWAMIPYDIEEPLFAVKADDAHFLVDLYSEDGHFTVAWFDYLPDASRPMPEAVVKSFEERLGGSGS